MRVLVVCSYKMQYASHIAPFIEEQVMALQKMGVTIDYFLIRGRGVLGYLSERNRLMDKIREFDPHIIHAHFGLSGLLANLQRRIPVVTTYHGSDINIRKVFWMSKICMRLSAWNIFVSQKNRQRASLNKKNSLLPCGVNLEAFSFLEKKEARKILGWQDSAVYILFAGAFDNPVKNASLAMSAVKQLGKVHLIEIKGYSREQMAVLYYASDVFLMTSHSEGSPQVIKEAMACGCPIVSVDVGDVAERICGLEGCFLAERTPEDVAQKLRMAISFEGRTKGREKIEKSELNNELIAKTLFNIYSKVLS